MIERALRVVCAGAAALFASPLFAQDAGAPGNRGVLLAPLRSSADVRAQVATFNELVAGEWVKQPGVELANAQLVGTLSAENQRVLKRGDAAAATMAAQAGSRFLAGGRLWSIGDLAVLSLFLVDAQKGKTIARQSVRQRGTPEALRGAVPALVAALAEHTRPFPAGPGATPPTAARVVDYNQGFLQDCYEQQLKSDPHLAGAVALQFRLANDGQIDQIAVDDAASAIQSQALFRCIENGSRQWKLPHAPLSDVPKDGAVKASFVFAAVSAPGSGGASAGARLERRLLPRSASAEGTLKASGSKQKATIRFENHTANPVQIYWLDFSGKRKRYPDLPARRDRTFPTFLGHPWLVADATGKSMEIFVPASPATLAVIEPALQARDGSQEGKLKSQSSAVPASIRFVNRTAGPVQLVWLDYDGKRAPRDRVASLQEKTLPTFVSHPWLALDAKGTVLAAFVVKEGGESVAIIEPAS